jgi:CSLREA domain-containing protein
MPLLRWIAPRVEVRRFSLLALASVTSLVVLGSAGHPLGASTAEAATTLTVNTIADVAADDGTDGDCSLRAAVRFANDPATGDPDCGVDAGGPYTIVLDGGETYALTTVGLDDTTLGGDLDIAAAVSVAVVVDGLNGATVQQTLEDRVFQVFAGATLSLDRVTVTGGFVPGVDDDGGGIHNAGTLTLTNSVVTDNSAGENGGGIFSTGTLTITASVISNNDAGFAGGGVWQLESVLTVAASEVSGNTAVDGGGGVALRRAGAAPGAGVFTVTDSLITGNGGTEFGGGLDNFGGSLTLLRTTVSDNSVSFEGGAIWNDDTLVITDSVIEGNSSEEEGGGIWNVGALSITDSMVTDNAAVLHGGGIFNHREDPQLGVLTIAGSTLSGNSAGEFGGAISNNGNLTITKSTLSGNSASEGGAFDNFGTAALTNSTISGNSADVTAGAIYVDDGAVGTTLTNVTVVANDSPTGALHNTGAAALLSLVNTIVAQNSDADCSGPVTSLGHNLDSDGSCLDGSVPGDIAAGDALLGALVNNGGPTATHALLPGSEALDAGDDAVCAAAPVDGQDQRGVARPQDGDDDGVAVCDIGAYEAEPTDGINNTNNNVIDLDNANDNTNGNDNANSNSNANDNDNQNDNENTNGQDQDNAQDHDNSNEQTNNIDSSPEVNIDFGE